MARARAALPLIARAATLVAAVVLVTAVDTAAAPYRWLDANGNVVYSDDPPRPEDAARSSAPGATASGAAAPVADPSVERLLDATGLKHQARLVAAQTREMLRGSLGNLDAERQRRVNAITDREFHPDAFYGVLRSEFGRHFNEPWLDEVLAWYATPVGRRIAEAEVRFYAADRRGELEEFVAGLVNNRPSPVRVALLQRLDAAGGATEGSLDLFVAINRAIIRVVEPLIPAQSRIRAGQLESQSRQIRLQLQEALKQVNVVTMLLLYQGVTDDELQRYIDFLETDAGAWYSGAARHAIVSAVTSTVERSAAELVRVVPPEQWIGAGLTKPSLPSEKLKL